MFNAIYIHSSGEAPAALSLHPCLAVQVYSTPVKQVVELLCDAQRTTLVLPNDYREHCAAIEHVKAIAHHMGLKVQPLTRYLDDRTAEEATPATTAGAAPTTQHTAVVA